MWKDEGAIVEGYKNVWRGGFEVDGEDAKQAEADLLERMSVRIQS